MPNEIILTRVSDDDSGSTTEMDRATILALMDMDETHETIVRLTYNERDDSVTITYIG